MNARLLLILAVVVAAIAGAAYYFGQERKALQSEAFQPGPLIADLDAKINDVDEARLESQEGGVLTLQRRDGAWAIPEHYGYPANAQRVRELLQKTASLRKIEEKTAKPENHKRLNLDDPADENSLATRITLKAGDATVGDVIVGLNRPPAHGGGAFVRLAGEDQTWLAEGEFKPRRRLIDLLDRNVVNIDGRRTQSARIQHPANAEGAEATTGEMLIISKAAPDQEKYSLGAAMPEGAQPKPEHELSSVARISDFLIFEDVKPATEIEMTDPVVGVYETFDGVRIIYRAQRQGDDKVWTTVTAEAGPRWDGLEAFVEAHKGEDTEAGRIADEMASPDAVVDEIAAISERTKGWAFRLTDYKVQRLTMKTEDLIELPEKPDAAQKQ